MVLRPRVYLSTTCYNFWYSCSFFITNQMPKYAVAVGRKIGVYNTYDECKIQVVNYPNAKFKKFNTEHEALEFIRKMSNNVPTVFGASVPFASDAKTSVPMMKENLHKPDLIKVEKISPSETTLNNLNNRINIMEQKLNDFIVTASEMFDGLTTRLDSIEGRLKRSASGDASVSSGPSNKRPKVQDMTSVGNFLYSDTGYVCVYTDGACTKNGKMGAMAGIGVWFNYNHPLNVGAPVKGPPTNNTAEIQAARVAITQAHRAGIKKLTVYTDSQFLINCITQWIYKWKKNDWQLSTGGPVKNKDELIKLDGAIQSIEAVEWVHVKGHQGIVGNEMADQLAKQGASQYRTNITFAVSVDE